MPGPQPPSPTPGPAERPAPPVRRTLVVVRHAQAASSAASDAERALTPSGVEDARALGSWLAARTVPSGALVSAATRTRETWEALGSGAGWDPVPPATVEASLYAAGEDVALDLVRATDPAVDCLVLVGHNPTMAVLAQLLDDGDGDPEVATAMLGGFPTATAAVLDLAGTWAELVPGGATLVGFHTARA